MSTEPSVIMQLRRAPRKSLERPSRKASQKSLDKPSRKASQNSLDKLSRKPSREDLDYPLGKSSQKNLKRRKAPRKSLPMQPSKASQKSLEKPLRKASQKCLEVLPSKASQKSLEKPSSKSSKKTSKAVVLSSQKNLGSKSKTVGRRQLKFCVICKRNFTTKKLLNEHNTKHHFFRHCPNCPKTFQQTRKFILHLRSHLEDHPYECKICLESFNQKKDLLIHKVVHRGSSRLRCDFCPEVFPHLASLNRHHLGHYGPPFPCRDCGAIFSNVPDRTVHIKNHVHRCMMCPREVVAFPSNVDLVIHMYQVHRTEELNPAESEADNTFEPCVSTGAVTLGDGGESDSMESDHESDENDEDLDSNYREDAVESVYNLKRKDKFICFICYDLYPSCELLKSHMKAHNWYPCNSCPRFFPDAETFEEHKCDFAELPSPRCQKCNNECEHCKRKDNMSTLQIYAPKFPEMPASEVTNYIDVTQRNCLVKLIEHLKSQRGLLDYESFQLLGYHSTNLKIILKNPNVNRLFPSHCINDLEELYSKFQTIIQNLMVQINPSAQ